MKSIKLDWRFLGVGMLWPGVSLLVAATILAASLWFYASEAATYRGHTTHHESMSEDYDALVDRRRLLDRYHRRYKDLQLQGFIGQESRLDWIETIRAIARKLELPNVTYSLEPQFEAVPPVPANSSGADIQIYLSKLELELELVHEADLLRFFGQLEQEAPGLMKVDRCSLERQFDSGQELRAETNIAANCSLAVFSVVTSDVAHSVARHSL